MTAAASALITYLTALLPGWTMQFGRWQDGDKTARFCVVRPTAGLPAELVRRPTFIVNLIGAANQPYDEIGAAADQVVEAMRAGSGGLVYLEAGDPAFLPTSDGRPVYEIAVSAITT